MINPNTKEVWDPGQQPVQWLVNRRNEEASLLWQTQSSQPTQWLPPNQIQSVISQCKTTAQCGEGVNQYLKKIGSDTHFVDSYESKKKEINSQTPVEWGVAIWQPTWKWADPRYGHVGIVLEDRWDKVLIHDWNWDGKESQATHEVSKSAIAQTGGYHIPETLQQSQQSNTQWSYNSEQRAVLSQMPAIKDIGKDERAILKKYNLSDTDVVSYNAQNQKGNDKYIDSIMSGQASLPSASRTEGANLRKEMAEKWYFDEWKWNEAYYSIPAGERQQLLNTVKARDAISKVKAIYDKHKEKGDANEFLGGYDQAFINAKRWVGMSTEFTKDYTEMERILWQELSRYIKDISGAGVTTQERQALQKNIPNLSMNEEQFEQALNAHDSTLGSSEDFIYKTYWIKDKDTLGSMLWQNNTQSQPSQSTQQSGQSAQNKKDLAKQILLNRK